MTREQAIKELVLFSGTTRLRLTANLWEALNMAIESLKVDLAYDLAYEEVSEDNRVKTELEPCEDYISREAVENITWEKPNYTDALNVLTEVRDKVRALPSVQPKQGHWKKYKHMIYCSECGASIEAGYLNDMKYCYNCGAIMESEVEEDE